MYILTCDHGPRSSHSLTTPSLWGCQGGSVLPAQERGSGTCKACGKNPACLGVQSWTWWTVLPLKRGTWGTGRQPPLWVSAALPACPLHQSLEPINTLHSYLQPLLCRKMGSREAVQDAEQTSRRTEVPTCLESPCTRSLGAHFWDGKDELTMALVFF